LAETQKEHGDAIERLREAGSLPERIEVTEDGFVGVPDNSPEYARADAEARAKFMAGMRDVHRDDLPVTEETLRFLEYLHPEADSLPRGDAAQRGAHLIAEAQAAPLANRPFGEATVRNVRQLASGRFRVTETNVTGRQPTADYDAAGLAEAHPEAFKPVANKLPGAGLTLDEAKALTTNEWAAWSEAHPEEKEALLRESSEKIELRTLERGRGGGIS
jgi:hypothetical protein